MRLLCRAAAAILICVSTSQLSTAQTADPSIFRFGQSAAFSGPSRDVGIGVRLGIEAAVLESNQNGGVNGAQILFTNLDDGYEPRRAITNVRELITEWDVFALIGGVGTPTSRAVVGIAREAQVPFVAPITGAAFLRDVEEMPNVINLRASSQQQVDEMVARLLEDRGISRVGVLYQDDSFGRTGLASAINSLARHDLLPVGTGVYERNTVAVKTAVLDLQLADPDAVIVIGANNPSVAAIKWSHEIGFSPVFLNISLRGGLELLQVLQSGDIEVFVTQVVPDFRSDELEIAKSYRRAVENYQPGSTLGYSSFEGYIAGRLLLEAMHSCGEEVTQECVIGRFRQDTPMNLGGLILKFGPNDNQGLDEVYLTGLNSVGQLVPVQSLNEKPR